MKESQNSGMNRMAIASLHSDKHDLISGFCQVCLKVFKTAAAQIVHIATSLERLRRKQIVVQLQVKIHDAALAGWIVTPLDSEDLDHMDSDLDF